VRFPEQRGRGERRIVRPMASETDVFTDALSLPTSDRARLARELLRSLDESEDPDAAEAWLTEIERRAREVKAGTAELEEWSTVRERLANRWRQR
jgi:putative addiction module component (TIGR02574 family)